MKPAGRRNPNCRFLCSFITENKNMCYTKIVTKKKGNKRYKIFKEDIEMAVVKLTTDNFDQEVLQAQQPVLVDFYADWCGPCKMMSPIVEALSEELSDVKVCHINIDENIDIAQKYRVMSIPTFIAFKGGEESGRQIGAIPKTALVDLVK